MDWVKKYVRGFKDKLFSKDDILKIIIDINMEILNEFIEQGFGDKKTDITENENTITLILPNFKAIFNINDKNLVINGYDLKDRNFEQIIVKYIDVNNLYVLLYSDDKKKTTYEYEYINKDIIYKILEILNMSLIYSNQNLVQ